jgi:peptidoglycan/LPS O-acetylase OafA/YrhL
VNGRRFEALDGCRGLAALIVLAYHAFAYAHPGQPLSGGYLAVDLFFVLSGFVLAHAYGPRLQAGLNPARFMALRLARLWPAYGIGIAAAVTIALLTTRPEGLWIATLAAIAFLPLPQDLGEGLSLFPLDLPAWSLFFELMANLAYVLLYRFLTVRRILALLALSAIGLVVVAARADGLHAGWAPDNFPGGAPRATFGFFAGVLIQRLWPDGLKPASGPNPALIGLAGLIALLALLVPVTVPFRPAFDVLVVVLVFPFSVATLAAARLSPPLGQATAVVGLISYPLYVLHMPFLPWLREAPVAGLLILLAASYLVGRWIEPPVRARLERALRV